MQHKWQNLWVYDDVEYKHKKELHQQQTNHAMLMMLKNKEKRGTINEKQRKLVHREFFLEWNWIGLIRPCKCTPSKVKVHQCGYGKKCSVTMAIDKPYEGAAERRNINSSRNIMLFVLNITGTC